MGQLTAAVRAGDLSLCAELLDDERGHINETGLYSVQRLLVADVVGIDLPGYSVGRNIASALQLPPHRSLCSKYVCIMTDTIDDRCKVRRSPDPSCSLGGSYGYC